MNTMNITKETKIASYINGNTHVTIFADGTKIREYENDPLPTYPESIDVKITNFCDMNCLYCHESSTTKGTHGNLDKLYSVLSVLPPGVELALGGGNPLSHPDLFGFLEKLKNHGFICNLTVNQGHLKTYQNFILDLINKNLIKGLGVSVVNNNFTYVYPLLQHSKNIVFHVIAGVNNIKIIDTLMSITDNCKVLILGYKNYGFGVNFYSDDVNRNLQDWYLKIRSYLDKCTMSFDNLAIEQLNLKRHFTTEGWDSFYMGDDFTFTMYIDAVEEVFAPTSRSKEKMNFSEISLLGYFKTYKK